MSHSDMRDTAEWADVAVDAIRRFNDHDERVKVRARLRENAGPQQRQAMLLTHLDDNPAQQTLFEEDH